MAAVIHETFGYGQDKEIDFDENSGAEEGLTSVDVDAGKNVSIYRKAYYCGPHRLSVPDVKVESYNISRACANSFNVDAFRVFASSVSNMTGQGIVTSPNYPGHYDDNVRIVYVLHAQTPNGKIKLDISTFNTENSHDKLVILDGSFGTTLAEYALVYFTRCY